MSINVTPHLNFRGTARAALEFYQSVFGGDLLIFTNADMFSAEVPEEAEQVKWGQVAGDNGFRVMAYDVPASQSFEPGVIPVFISVRGKDVDEVTGYWAKLAEGATVLAPLEPAQWAPLYGMLKDRFGVTWVLDVEAEYTAA